MVFVVVISVFIWLSACFRSELNQVTWSDDFRIGASINLLHCESALHAPDSVISFHHRLDSMRFHVQKGP